MDNAITVPKISQQMRFSPEDWVFALWIFGVKRDDDIPYRLICLFEIITTYPNFHHRSYSFVKKIISFSLVTRCTAIAYKHPMLFASFH